MEDEFDVALRELHRKAGERAPREEALKDAWELKRALLAHAADLNATMNNLDQMVFKWWRDDAWVWGWTPEQVATAAAVTTVIGGGKQAGRYDRKLRALEIAATLAESAETVLVSDIISALRPEGEELEARALATSVGNFLTRSGKWRRVAPGEYESIKVDAPLNGREAPGVERSQVD